MQKANKIFILSEVADHILAKCESVTNGVVFTFCHKDDKTTNNLKLSVKAAAEKSFVISYRILHEGKELIQADSDPVPGAEVQWVIAHIVNDAIPHCR